MPRCVGREIPHAREKEKLQNFREAEVADCAVHKYSIKFTVCSGQIREKSSFEVAGYVVECSQALLR